MKTANPILAAFLLNLSFSIFEGIGGIATGSVAIVSDAVHDAGDAVSIGIACFLETVSKRHPDETHTYGYARYAVLGGCITSLMLLIGSVTVIVNAVNRILVPTPIHYSGMILFAVVGVCVNLLGAVLTHKGDSLNQKAVNLHMLEDVLGWAVVLVGAIVMRFTDIALIDPLMSIGVSLYILIHAIKTLIAVMDVFLEKTPHTMEVTAIQEHIEQLDGVLDAHHIHLWSLDGRNHIATMHVVTDRESYELKKEIRKTLHKHGIGHTTIELETPTEHCGEQQCPITYDVSCEHHHHHHLHKK